MNIEQIENRNKSIINNAIEWANNRECLPLEQLDIVVIGEYYNIRIPKCFHNFVYSENPNHAKVCGSEKTIFKTLDKIKSTITELL